MFLKIIELKFERVATHEEIIHRQRNPRHVGRDGLVRPSIAHETLGNFIFHVNISSFLFISISIYFAFEIC